MMTRRTLDSDYVRNKETIKLVASEIWSKGNVDLIPKIFAENYVGHFPGETISGLVALSAFVESHRNSFPDWNEEVLEIIIEGDSVATRYRSRGTHLGSFQGIPATGKEIEILEASIIHMEKGLIAEQWAFPDILSLQQQLSNE